MNKLRFCRLAEGRTLLEVCSSIHKHARKLQPGAELNELKAWMWLFALQTIDYMSRVSCCHHALSV